MNLLDYLLLIIVGYSVIAGFMAGFARVGIGIAATICGILFGLWFYRMPAAWIQEYVQSHSAANLLGFFLIFSIIVLAGGLLGRMLSNIFKWVGLSWLDRFLGAAFGFVRGSVLAVAIVTVITAFAPNPPPRFIVESKMMPYATAAGHVFAVIAPRELKDGYNATLSKLKQIWDRVPIGKPEKIKGETI